MRWKVSVVVAYRVMGGQLISDSYINFAETFDEVPEKMSELVSSARSNDHMIIAVTVFQDYGR